MHHILKGQFKQAISNLEGNNFQNFCNELFMKKYGDNFVSVKNKKDQGADGILENESIIAIYSPEKENLKAFRKKVKEDYEKYEKNWKKSHPKWIFIYNRELTSERIKYIKNLNSKTIILDISKILDLIDSLTYIKLKSLAEVLAINTDLIIYDVIKNVVDDLIKICKDLDKSQKSKISPPKLLDKIQKNYEVEKVESIKKEYEEIIPEIQKLQNILKEYDDNEISALINKVQRSFGNLSGPCSLRIKNLVEYLSNNHIRDDLYIFYVRVIVFYLFERCIIGEDPKKAK